jgi:hypothetical protein
MRSWSKIGAALTDGRHEEFDRMFKAVRWQSVADPAVEGVMPAMAIDAAIEAFRLPEVTHYATSIALAPLGLLALRCHYKMGTAEFYLADRGGDLVMLASDFYLAKDANP